VLRAGHPSVILPSSVIITNMILHASTVESCGLFHPVVVVPQAEISKDLLVFEDAARSAILKNIMTSTAIAGGNFLRDAGSDEVRDGFRL